MRKDPRFEDLSGKYVPERFRKQYSFLYEEVLPQERSSLRSAAKVTRTLHSPGIVVLNLHACNMQASNVNACQVLMAACPQSLF